MTLRIRLAALLIACAAGAATPRAEDPPATKDAKPAAAHDPFESTDLEFRSLYASGRAATLAKLGPVIAVEMDDLVLIRDGKRTEAKVIPPIYHRLKSVSHVPLAIYVALAPFGDAPLGEDRIMRLREFRASISALSDALAGAGFSEPQLARSKVLLTRCRTFLDDVIAKGRYELPTLLALTKSAGPIVLANANDAARAQIDAYHARVGEWRRSMTPEDWAKLHVVILGPQMPRKHNVAVQYFAKLLGQAGESKRVVYAEELQGEAQAINLLTTHEMDSRLSDAFFGDPDRMEIDLLGNAASVYLDGFDFSR